MSFIYCNQDRRNVRWYYQESPGWRQAASGSHIGFSCDKAKAYRFDTKEEAWAHCRVRRHGGHPGGRGKWIVIKLAAQVSGVGEKP